MPNGRVQAMVLGFSIALAALVAWELRLRSRRFADSALLLALTNKVG